MLRVMIPANPYSVDVNKYTRKYARIPGSTPWTVGVDPSLLIVTREETGPFSKEDSMEQLNSIAIGLNMSMDSESPMENIGWDWTTSTA